MIQTSGIHTGHRHRYSPRQAASWLGHSPSRLWQRVLRELSFIAVFALLYEEIRDHMVQAGATAMHHALDIVHLEQDLGIFHERSVQSAVIRSDTVTDAFNAYYGGTHFLIPILVLAFLLVRHPAHYGRARTTLAVITGLAFACFWLFPVAPPRLLPHHFGIIDTLAAPDGAAHMESALLNSAGDQYASMPSLHVAWAVWCALALWPVWRHWALRALAVAYPVVTTLVVVATGNHFFLDAAAGALLACLSWVAVTRATAWLSARAAASRGVPAGISAGHAERAQVHPAASSATTSIDSKNGPPNVVAMATSEASRPRPITTRPLRLRLLRGSNVHHRSPSQTSIHAAKSIGAGSGGTSMSGR